jgi:3-hydroxyacyl-CoA dehydrogenase
LIIESVSENYNIKKEVYEQIEKYRNPETIVGTTTSSLSLTNLCEGRSEDFRRNFLSLHFYNPPGRMLACEIAAQPDTSVEVFDYMRDFLNKKLNRKIVPVKNVAGFAGNRIAFLIFNKITSLALAHGVEILDYLIGPYTGRIMPPLATIDLVGLDIYKAIVNSLNENTNGKMREFFVLPEYICKMIDGGILGNKTGGGFYTKLESGKFMFFDPKAFDYVPAIQPHVAFVEKAKNQIHLGMYKQAFQTIIGAKGQEAEIVKDILCTYIFYAFSQIGRVTDEKYGIEGIDRVMAYGFNWAPPSVIVYMFGGKENMAEMLQEKGFSIPEGLINLDDRDFRISNYGKFFIAR